MIELKKCRNVVSQSPPHTNICIEMQSQKKILLVSLSLSPSLRLSRNWFRFYSSSSKTRLLLQICEETWILFYVIPPPPPPRLPTIQCLRGKMKKADNVESISSSTLSSFSLADKETTGWLFVNCFLQCVWLLLKFDAYELGHTKSWYFKNMITADIFVRYEFIANENFTLHVDSTRRKFKPYLGWEPRTTLNRLQLQINTDLPNAVNGISETVHSTW